MSSLRWFLLAGGVIAVLIAIWLGPLAYAVQRGGDTVRTTIELEQSLGSQEYSELEMVLEGDLGFACQSRDESDRCSRWEDVDRVPAPNFIMVELANRKDGRLIFVRSLPETSFIFSSRVGDAYQDTETQILAVLGSSVARAERYARLVGQEQIVQLR